MSARGRWRGGLLLAGGIWLATGCGATPPAASAPGTVAGTVAYIARGNLVVRNLAQRRATMVARGGVTRLAWSPRGDRLAFLRAGRLEVRSFSQGTPWDLGRASWFRWSPAHNALAFSVPGQGLWLAMATATGTGWRVRRADANAYWAAWSPGGKRLAFPSPGQGITVMAVGAGTRQRFLPASTISASVPGQPPLAWAPNGRQIAFVQATSPGTVENPGADQALRLLDPGNGRIKTLDTVRGGGIVLAGWWPGGQGVLFWPVPLNSMSLAADGLGLQWIRTSGGGLRTLGTMLLNRHFLVPSPGGNRLAVVAGSVRDAPFHKSLILVGPGSSGTRHLAGSATVSAIFPAWSPNGRRIAYLSMPSGSYDYRQAVMATGSFHWSVWTVGAGGGEPVRVTHPQGASDQWVRFTPDGRHLLVVRYLAGHYAAGRRTGPGGTVLGEAQIWLLGLHGGHPRLIASHLQGDPIGYYGQADWNGGVALRPSPGR